MMVVVMCDAWLPAEKILQVSNAPKMDWPTRSPFIGVGFQDVILNLGSNLNYYRTRVQPYVRSYIYS